MHVFTNLHLLVYRKKMTEKSKQTFEPYKSCLDHSMSSIYASVPKVYGLFVSHVKYSSHSLGQTSTFDIVSQTKVSASCYADCSFHTSNTIHIVWYRHGHLTWCFLSSKEQKFHRKANSRPDMPELDICIRRTLVTQSQKHGSLYQEAYSFSSSEFRWRVWFI